MTRIGFIGLGNMGAHGRQPGQGGAQVQVFDLVPESLSRAIRDRLPRRRECREAVSGCELVISMLPAGEHVRSLWLGRVPVSRAARICWRPCRPRPGHRLLHRQTWPRPVRWGRRRRRQHPFSRCPVSGRGGAAAGTLTFIVGGEQADFEAARPVLACMGQNLFHAGALGAGQIARCATTCCSPSTWRAPPTRWRSGVRRLDPAVLSTIMGKSSGNNWSLERYNPGPG